MMVEEVCQREPLPFPVGLHRIVCYGDYGLYLIGGATYTGQSRSISSRVYNAQTYKFNLSTKKWTKMAPVAPSFDDDHAACVGVKRKPRDDDPDDEIVLASRCAAFIDNRRLLIAGGRLLNRRFDVASNSTYVYDVQSQTTIDVSIDRSSRDRSTDRSLDRLPTNHGDFFNQKLLAWNDSYVLCSRVLDETTGRKRFLFHSMTIIETVNENRRTGLNIGWRDISPIAKEDGSRQEPFTGDLCELAIYDNFVYCIDKNDKENCLDVQWRYDLRCRRWENVETLADSPKAVASNSFFNGKPLDRLFTSSVTYGDSVYVVGGTSMSWAGPKSSPVFSDIWKLHLPTLRWSLMPVSLPEGLWFHSVDVSPSGCMYVFGGFSDIAGRKPTQKLWRVHLDAPPLLSNSCWRSVLKMHHFNLDEKTDEELKNMRIPLCFIWALRW